MPPGVECRILDAESFQLVLEPCLEGMNIDLPTIGLGEDPLDLFLFMTRGAHKTPRGEGSTFHHCPLASRTI